MIRKTVILIVATAMAAGGAGLLFTQFMLARVIYGWGLMAGAALLSIGVGWLWVDIVRPVFDAGRHPHEF